jgi:hypothetical protein
MVMGNSASVESESPAKGKADAKGKGVAKDNKKKALSDRQPRLPFLQRRI